MPKSPRGVDDTLRVQEFTGGFHPREMVGDYDVNPNEDADGLSHHNREAASNESIEQRDPKARKERAFKELEGGIPHISLDPEEIEATIDNTPMTNGESELLESGLGVDMGHLRGIGVSTGANVGPISREGPGMIFGRSNDAFEDAWSIVKDNPLEEHIIERLREEYDKNPRRFGQGFIAGDGNKNAVVGGAVDGETIARFLEEQGSAPSPEQFTNLANDYLAPYKKLKDAPPLDKLKWLAFTPAHAAVPAASKLPDDFVDDPNYDDTGRINELDAGIYDFGNSKESSNNWQQKNASADPPFIGDIVKGKRKTRGRRYDSDEESDEEEKKSKAKRKRKRKRKMKDKKKRGSRDIKGITARRAGAAEQNVSRETKRQVHPRRMMGGNPRSKAIPLRLRDPIAYQRKLANEKMARQTGALPRHMTGHRGAAGGLTDAMKVQTIGLGGKGTKMPSQPSSSKGTSLSHFKGKNKESGSLIGDPLGGDPLKMLEKRADMQISAKDWKNFSRSDILALKRDLKKLLKIVEGLKKATPELGSAAKRGGQANKEVATAPGDQSLIREEETSAYRFGDVAAAQEIGLVGKK